MKVTVLYAKTAEPVVTYYSVRKIERDEPNSNGIPYATLFFDRDEEDNITILSPVSLNMDKYNLLVDNS